MSLTVTKTARAQADLEEIWSFIAADNVEAADGLLDAVAAQCLLLAGQQRAGRARPELGESLRSLAVGRYVIFYRPAEGGIEVVRVLHGARDIGEVFGDA